MKKIARKFFLGRFLLSELHALESWLVPLLISDEKAVRKFYKRSTGKELNLENPQGFTEKLNWYKLNGRMPLMQQCADKVAVRDYVASKGLGNTLNDVYCVYDKISQIDINSLPDRFVLKATHGSHMGIIVKDKSKINWFKQKLMMWSWLHQNIYWSGREWVYKDIPKKIVAEKYLEDENGELRDYKFFCFNGVPTYMQYDIGRYSVHKRNFYDMNGKIMEIHDYLESDHEISFPLSDEIFAKMRHMAAILASPFQFVRTDFYLVKDKIYFGEMTFFHEGGNPKIKSEKDDLEFGKKWRIQK